MSSWAAQLVNLLLGAALMFATWVVAQVRTKHLDGGSVAIDLTKQLAEGEQQRRIAELS